MYLADKVCSVLVQRALYCITDRLTEIIVHYGMEMNVEKTKIMRMPKLPSAIQFMIDQKPPKNVEHLKKIW